jgi:cell pole-organizing protein PopZ
MPKASAKDTIVDNATEDATASAFASLNKVIDEKATMADRGDRIGDLVQEALRPMLKEWLDKNLKGIVERAVTKEVKRISSGK